MTPRSASGEEALATRPALARCATLRQSAPLAKLLVSGVPQQAADFQQGKVGGRLLGSAACRRFRHRTGRDPRTGADQLASLSKRVDAGKLRVEVSARYPLAEAASVHELGATDRMRGKVLLTPAS